MKVAAVVTDVLRSYREISGQLEGILIERLLQKFAGKLTPMAKAFSANLTTLRKKQSSKYGIRSHS